MQFREWLIVEGKYLANSSAVCEHCKGDLSPTSITENNNHIYEIGQYWTCPCRKSRIWTNSVRNEKRLLEYLSGKSDRYTNGFCNDLFCGYCFSPVYPLKNGVYPIRGIMKADLCGCNKCVDNKNIQIWFGDFLEEGKEIELKNWYKQHMEEFSLLVKN